MDGVSFDYGCYIYGTDVHEFNKYINDVKKLTILFRVHIESVNSLGQTPLFCASYGGDYEVVKVLLRLGANPNRRCGSRGAAPIHAASYRGSRRVLRYLVEAGGDLSLRDAEQQSPRRSAHQSTASVWSSCVSEISSSSNPVSQDEIDTSKTKEIVLTPNLHKSVSCHLLDQLCVTTSLPLLSPAQLQRPQIPSPAYTCGGPTVYSSFSWIGTPVTVRRPTPALALSNYGKILNEGPDGDSPDQDAVRSLLHELSFLRRLRHPGFLEVMAACHVTHPSPDHVTLVYQHVPHGSLYHHLHVQHHDLSVGGAVDILIGLVEALLFMHAHGWYHCGLSSHALHLISLGSAKLGGFEYAFESQVKGVGMRAEHISKCGWLRPWQSPETILEKMVSVRTEVYSVATIIWEMWSGMPPWAGVEEDEISKRIEKGEVLPTLKGTTLSLVSYLTEYGLKWNSHERELDLQEVHTMLRSLRIQCNEDERVPAVTSWGPPSIPNTPVIGRQTASKPLDSSLSSSSSGELRLGNGIVRPLGYQNGSRVSYEGSQGRILGEKTPMRQVAKVKGGDKNVMMKSNFERAHEIVKKHFSIMGSDGKNEEKQTQESSKGNDKENRNPNNKERREAEIADSQHLVLERQALYTIILQQLSEYTSPSILTSTPVRSTTCCKTDGQKPDLLPNKVTPKAFMSSAKNGNSPDILPPDSKFSKGSNCESDENFNFIQNAAKRAFLQSGGETESDSVSSAASSPVSERERRNKKNFPIEIVKRGLSLSNICGSALTCPSATVFTRTTSHISLSSSSSGDICGKRPPQRTISQVTLTMRKLSLSSSSASSVNSSDSLVKAKGKDEKVRDLGSSKADSLLSEGKKFSVTKTFSESKKVPDRREMKKKDYCNEIVGIKPASHQLTRHSSSCSLASGPPSPGHTTSLSVFNSSRNSRLTNSHDCLSTSPKSDIKHQTLPLSPRPLSLFADKGSLLSEATGAANSKSQSRRHSESYKKNRRTRRKHDLEMFYEEIVCTLALYFKMPFVLDVAVNTCFNRFASFMEFIFSSSSSLSLSQTSRQVTSSEEDDDDIGRRVRGAGSTRRPVMKALEETGDSDDGTENKSNAVSKVNDKEEGEKAERKGERVEENR
ncbi:Inactive serine/threonine-protein kinase TEX14 [Armadillidium vulgare]|nr:Inactive serine/threonine-protein kinase TEX14 [Armadillidium vulgare]